jgi:RimJ/RimL family protein N-acetyltransferase
MQTSRMSLRLFTATDAHYFKELDSDPAVMTWLTGGVPSTDEQVKASSERVLALQEKHQNRFGIWLAFLKDTHEFMGWFLFRPDKKDPENTHVIELGYRLKQKFWRQGFASEGSERFLELGFQEYQVDEIFAITMLGNVGSQAVMKKIGMRFLYDYMEVEMPMEDKRAVRYSLKRSDWR